jgi:hypothetical protein
MVHAIHEVVPVVVRQNCKRIEKEKMSEGSQANEKMQQNSNKFAKD